jgi:site-specific DNA-cytosine methylase
MKKNRDFNAIEVCAGAGGQAIELEQARFEIFATVELDSDACAAQT